MPELVTANQGEAGIEELCELLIERGIGIEAGLLQLSDGQRFVKSGLVESCVRVLVEPLDAGPAEAVAHAASMEEVLAAASVRMEQVHHGDGAPSWHVLRDGGLRKLELGRGDRVGAALRHQASAPAARAR